jgi:hypothetical protein
MSYTYLVTVVGLDAGVTTVTTGDSKEDIGHLDIDQIFTLVEKLRAIDPAAARKVDAALIVRRGDKAWRINAHHGSIRVYHSSSSLDDYWTVTEVNGIGELAPFRPAITEKLASKGPGMVRARGGILRTIGEIGGLAAVAIILMGVAIYFGTPRRKLSDPPEGFRALSAAESEDIFRRMAGVYATGRKPGNQVLMIHPDGRVVFSKIGKDGQPIVPPRLEEKATAGRQGDAPAVHTSLATITVSDQGSVNVGAYEWKRTEPL